MEDAARDSKPLEPATILPGVNPPCHREIHALSEFCRRLWSYRVYLDNQRPSHDSDSQLHLVSIPALFVFLLSQIPEVKNL